MIIDFHTHCFPDKIAARAVESLGKAAALVPACDGTADGLLKSMKEDKIDISVVLNIATNPHQQTSVNNFATELNKKPRLIAFGSVHPDADDALDELERIAGMGLKGVKFHPEYQDFFVDDVKMRPIYKKISQLGLITVFHAGADYGFPAPYKCMPDALARALKWFDSPVIAAHWGGIMCHDEVINHLCGLPLYFDVSFSYGAVALPMVRQIAEKHGTDKLLFGSDSPWHKPSEDMRVLHALDMDEVDINKICCDNAIKLLGIKGV